MTEKPTPQPRALTLSEVRAAAKEIVDERPTHSMGGERCMYRDDAGAPVCLVGAIFHKVDPDLFNRFAPATEVLMMESVARGLLGNYSTINSVASRHGIAENWEPGVLTYLDRMQSMQDGGATWINAFESAELMFQTLNEEQP